MTDIHNMLNQLKQRRAAVEFAIITLHRLHDGSGAKRRGRPPKLPELGTINSSASRARHSEAMRQYWARKRASAQTSDS